MYLRNISDPYPYWFDQTEDVGASNDHFFLFVLSVVQALYILFCCGFFGFLLACQA